MGGPVHNVRYGAGYHIPHIPALRKCYGQKHPRPPPPPLARTTPSGIHPIHWLWRIHSEPAKAVKNAEAAPAPAQASEPPEADPRAWMKSHLYWVAQTSSDLHLRRDFPRYKTMLDGWDSQSLSWQANKAAMAEHFGVTTKDLRREWGELKRLSPEEQGSRAQP